MDIKKFFRFFFYFILIMLLLTAASFILPVYHKYKVEQEKLAKLRELTAIKTAASIRLHQEIEDLKHNPHAVEKVAREKFGLCRDGELILEYKPPAKQ